MNVELLVPTARRQFGLVTQAQAKAAGISRSAWYRALDQHALEQIHPGVAALPGAPESVERAVKAALLAVGDDAMATATTGGWRWGAEWPPIDPIHLLTTNRKRGIQLDGVVLHRPADGARLRPVVREGLDVANPLRTVLDAAAVLPPAELAAGIDRLVVTRVVTVRTLHRALEDHRVRGRRGNGTLRLVLGDWALGDTPPDSVLEVAMARLLRHHRLPAAVFHHRVRTAGGTFELDFGLLDDRIDLEVDGWAFHEGRGARERDRRRDAELAAVGWRVLRFTWFQVSHRPEWVAEVIRRTIAAGRRLPR